MNRHLVSRLQHGCQDDFLNTEKNPGVNRSDHFLAIRMGAGISRWKRQARVRNALQHRADDKQARHVGLGAVLLVALVFGVVFWALVLGFFLSL